MAKLSVGDVFAVPVTKDEQLFGRVLLDVREQCIKPKRLRTSSPLTFFKTAHLVEVTRDETGSQVVLPGLFVHAVERARMGHREVDPNQVEFPWSLSLYGPQPHLYWGELQIPVELAIPEYRKMEVSPSVSPVESLGPSALYQLGRAGEIDRSKYQDIELFNPALTDLRASPNSTRIAELVAGRVLGDYAATAAAYGYDLARLYSADRGKRELVLCAYCNASLVVRAGSCAVCAKPIGIDAPVSVTIDALAIEDRKPCKACTAPILAYASICRWCKTRQ